MKSTLRLPILVYHNIRFSGTDDMDNLITISAENFVRQMQYLRENEYRTLSANEVLDFIEGRIDEPKVVALHFDDGWRNQIVVAPLFSDLGFKATFWIVPGFTESRPDMMNWNDLSEMAKIPSFDFQCHTMTHPCNQGGNLINMLDNGEWGILEREITSSREIIEKQLGQKVDHFAWPCGIYNESLIEVARKAGYKGIFTTDGGVNSAGDSPLCIRRTMIHGRCSMDDFIETLQTGKFHDYG